jgi:hypothetical protein
MNFSNLQNLKTYIESPPYPSKLFRSVINLKDKDLFYTYNCRASPPFIKYFCCIILIRN